MHASEWVHFRTGWKIAWIRRHRHRPRPQFRPFDRHRRRRQREQRSEGHLGANRGHEGQDLGLPNDPVSDAQEGQNRRDRGHAVRPIAGNSDGQWGRGRNLGQRGPNCVYWDFIIGHSDRTKRFENEVHWKGSNFDATTYVTTRCRNKISFFPDILKQRQLRVLSWVRLVFRLVQKKVTKFYSLKFYCSFMWHWFSVEGRYRNANDWRGRLDHVSVQSRAKNLTTFYNGEREKHCKDFRPTLYMSLLGWITVTNFPSVWYTLLY